MVAWDAAARPSPDYPNTGSDAYANAASSPPDDAVRRQTSDFKRQAPAPAVAACVLRVLFNLDPPHLNHAAQQAGVALDAVGQAFGRGACHLPALGEELLAHLGAACNLAEQA